MEPPVTGCPVNDTPTFELGSGETAFESLVDGQDLQMASGTQGGCHFWLAGRTTGFAQRRFKVGYSVRFADTGTVTGVGDFRISLQPVDATGQCEFFGFTAFLVRGFAIEDRAVIIDVEVEDDLGKKATASRQVTARWPDEVPGTPRELLCGRR